MSRPSPIIVNAAKKAFHLAQWEQPFDITCLGIVADEAPYIGGRPWVATYLIDARRLYLDTLWVNATPDQLPSVCGASPEATDDRGASYGCLGLPLGYSGTLVIVDPPANSRIGHTSADGPVERYEITFDSGRVIRAINRSFIIAPDPRTPGNLDLVELPIRVGGWTPFDDPIAHLRPAQSLI